MTSITLLVLATFVLLAFLIGLVFGRMSIEVWAGTPSTMPETPEPANPQHLEGILQRMEGCLHRFEAQVAENPSASPGQGARLGSPPEGPTHRNAPDDSDSDTTDAAEEDQRRAARHLFLCKQWVAPYRGDRFPEGRDFLSVWCRDLSSCGISLYLDQRPTSPMFILRLTGERAHKYVTARIVRTTTCPDRQFGQYLVACELVRMIDPGLLPHSVADLG